MRNDFQPGALVYRFDPFGDSDQQFLSGRVVDTPNGRGVLVFALDVCDSYFAIFKDEENQSPPHLWALNLDSALERGQQVVEEYFEDKKMAKFNTLNILFAKHHGKGK